MKKLLVVLLSMLILGISTVLASEPPYLYTDNQTNECLENNTNYWNYYLTGTYTGFPFYKIIYHNKDIKINTGSSLTKIWRGSGVITTCSGWYLLSNVIPKSSTLPGGAYGWESPCSFQIPNYTKENNSAKIDAQISYTLGYNEIRNKGGSSLSGRFYYRDFNLDKLRCYPNGNIAQNNSINACQPSVINYDSTIKIITGACSKFRVFRCGDGLRNGYNGSINYDNDKNKSGVYLHSYTEECDPNDPNQENWGVGGCTTTCQRNNTPTGPVCGNGELEEGEQCEFSVGGTSPRLGGGKPSGMLEFSQGTPSNENLGCDSNCQLKPVSCTLSSSPIEQLVGQPITFTATKDNWANYISLNFGDNTNIVQNPVFPVNHTYSIAGDFQPLLTVKNNYTGIIRTGVTIPTATCIANSDNSGGNNTGVNIVSGCAITLSDNEIELGDSFSVNYTVWGNFNSPVKMISIPQIGNQITINKKGRITTGTVNYNGTEISHTGSYIFSISGTLNNGMNTPFTCQATLQVVEQGVVGFDLKKVLDYMSGDIVHYTITLTNTGNTVAHNAYIKDTVPSAVTYLTSSIAGVQRYSFDILEENGTTVFIYSGLTINPGQSVVVSFTGRIDTGELIDIMVGEALSDRCSEGVRLQVERSFGIVYSAQTQNCAETSGNIICEDMPEPTILKQQKKAGMAGLTHDNIQVELGDTISYRVDFGNSSSGEVHGVKIEDYLPRCIQYISSSIYGVHGATFNTGTTSLGSTKITYSQFTLNGGETGYILLTGKIKNTPDCASNYAYTNKAYIYFTNKIIFDKVKAKTAKDNGRDIKKQADKQFVNEGENLTYTIIYRNTGDIAWSTGYTLVDIWPENLNYVSDSCNGVCTKTVSNGEHLYTINQSLEGGDSRQLILTGKVTQCPEWGMIVNKVKLEFGREDNTTGEIEGVSVVICGPDGWTVRKEADKTYVGNLDDITYTISYRNTGSTEWNTYRLEDEWPAQYLTYKSDSCAGGCTKSVNGNVYTYRMAGSLPAGGTGRLILTGQVGSGLCDGINGGIKNIVRLIYTTIVDGKEVEGVTTGEATIYCGSGDDDGWTLKKEADKSNVSEGEKLTYKIYYRNTGGVAWEPGYQLTDIWPESLAYGGDTCNGVCSKEEEDGKYIYTMNESLLSGEGRELILTGIVESCPEWGMLTNEVILKYRADGVDGVVTGYSVVICGDDDGWTVKKEADKTRVNNGDNVTYTISYRNTGSTVWNSYRLEDDWPAQYLTYKSDSCVGSCHTGVNGNIHIYSMDGTLVPGGTGRLILTGQVGSGVCDSINGGIVNTVRLIYTTIVNGQPVTGTITGSVEISCDLSDGWGIKKEANPTHVKSGEKITYTITYRNTGDKAWEPGYQLTDIWPEKVDYKGSTCNGACRETVVRKNKEYKYTVNEKLDGGESKQLILTGIVKECPEWGMITNKVILKYRADGVDGEIEGYSVVICGDDDGWTVKKEADKTGVNNGDNVTYTISYRNTGSTVWNSYRLEDDWPAQYLAYKSDSCVGSCHTGVNGNTHIYSMDGTLVPGGTGRLILTGQVGSGVCDSINGGIVNTVRLIYTTVVNGQPVIGTITGSVVINCNPNGDKEGGWLRKTATPKKIDVGEKITYKITYKNTGEHVWDSYTLTDTWPSKYIDFDESSIQLEGQSNDKYVLNGGKLERNDKQTIIITGIVRECPEGKKIQNKVEIVYTVKDGDQILTNEISAATASVTCGGGDGIDTQLLGALYLPISVMVGEQFPFIWNPKIAVGEEEIVSENDCSSDRPDSIKKESMNCTFVLYNGSGHNQEQVLNGDGKVGPVTTITLPCFSDYNNNYIQYIVDVARNDRGDKRKDTDRGKYVTGVDKIFDAANDTYGEYKMQLRQITGNKCDGSIYDELVDWEADILITKPYLMQINTVGIIQTSSNFLNRFYDIVGNNMMSHSGADISSKILSNTSAGSSEKNLAGTTDSFKKKYQSLAVKISENDKTKWRNGRATNAVRTIKKVPNKSIYFVSGGGNLEVPEFLMTSNKPFTIFIEDNKTVTIPGSMRSNGMIIAPQGTIRFEDSNCTDGGQIVRGIFIASEFMTDNNHNRNPESDWCNWGNLDVQGVLIGSGIDYLAENRRSNLNKWFEIKTDYLSIPDKLISERRKLIFEGASLLLNYNSELWSQLPPGAEVFTEKLDVFKK